MSEQAVAEYAMALRARYQAGGRQEKGRILDEFCATTGMHRKAAIRLMNRRAGPERSKRGRPRRYGPEVSEALIRVWEVSDRMCGKLLVAVMKDVVEALERHGELALKEDVRGQLLAVSAATIDRLLSRHRRRLRAQPYRRSVSSGLKEEVPVRTWSEWKGAPLGSLQADLVLHCGESTEGFYLASLCAIDVASGWTELEPVWGHGKQRVGTAIHHVRQRLPFPMQSLHTDNGSEFINHTLYNWCREEGVAFTRGRSYRKNDQAYVEQRNWLTVRRQVGYDRLATKEAYALLQKLYPLLCLQLNFFRPVRKLASKERSGARVTKRYDVPKTAYQRAIESKNLSVDERLSLTTKMAGLNPADLQRRIEGYQRELWRISSPSASLDKDVG
jgi:hypothetical protein